MALQSRNRSPGSATKQVVRIQGVTYESKLVDCGKSACRRCNPGGARCPSHGPYWYLCYTYQARTCRVYLGKDLDTARFRGPDGELDLDLVRAAHRQPKLAPPPAPRPATPGEPTVLPGYADQAPTPPMSEPRPGLLGRMRTLLPRKASS